MSKYPGRIVTDLAPAGYSVAFDGSGDYLTVADSSTLEPSNSNFTIECWIYPTATGSFLGVFSKRATNANYSPIQVLINSGTMILYASTDGSSWAVNQSASSSPSLNTWSHIAVVRNGTGSNNLTLYLNGTSVATGSVSSTALVNNTGAWAIGADAAAGTGNFSGYISNFRYVLGTAIYTAAFTPPTQLFNIPNTQLLTCNSPAIVDQSTNNFTITANGNVAVSTLTPFTAYVPYNPALGASTPGIWTVDEAMQAAATRQWNMYDPSFNLTTLLLHGNGTNGAQNNTFLDSSSNNFTITRNPASGPNAPTQGSFSPFSQTGWSNFFTAASSQFISLPNNAAFQFGAPSGNTNDFVVEFFVYPTTTAISAPVHTGYTSGTTYWGFNLNRTTGGVNTAGHVQFYLTDSFNVTATTGLISNQQNHICAVRTGTTVSLFVNGVRQATGTSSVNPNPTGLLYVGGEALSLGRYLDGYVSNLRIIKGATLPYDANALSITVPTSQLTAITGTTVLTCQSNRFVDNSTNNFTISTSGTPSVQAFSPFYPTAAYTPQTIGGSGFFDGTGDYLSNATAAVADFGTGDFTFECWFYLTALSTGSYYQIFSASNTAGAFQVYKTITSNDIVWDVNSVKTLAILSGSSLSTNTWYHIAVVRSGSGSNNLKTYVNGAQTFQYTDSTNFTVTGAYVGAFATGVSNWPGYIAGLRILKGTALAPSGIPTAPPTAIANTSFLLNFTNAGIVDSTAKNALETVGNAQISTTQSVFGGSSMFFDGTDDYLFIPQSNNPQNLNWELVRGDFTIEFWFRANTVAPTIQGLIVKFDGDAASRSEIQYMINLAGSSLNCIPYQGGTVYDITFTSAIAANTWYHVAFVRSGSSFYAFLNGVRNATTRTIVGDLNSGTNWPLFIGRYVEGGVPYHFNGFIDDLRITRFARYTGNFTPQTSQWQDQ